jgi:hypothetical protein
VLGVDGGVVRLLDHLSGAEEEREVDAVVAAVPRRARGLVVPAGPVVVRIGDALAPRLLDAAVREGHDAAHEIGNSEVAFPNRQP